MCQGSGIYMTNSLNADSSYEKFTYIDLGPLTSVYRFVLFAKYN
jgi:hypothetical protein